MFVFFSFEFLLLTIVLLLSIDSTEYTKGQRGLG
jgi:hypothetical protein